MNPLLQKLYERAKLEPESLVIEGPVIFTAKRLLHHVECLGEYLQQHNISSLGLYADNGPAWIIVDLACQLVDACLVPLPVFFSQEQLQHAVNSAGISAIFTDQPKHIAGLIHPDLGIELQDIIAPKVALGLALWRLPTRHKAPTLPDNTLKITYTSGSTGQPKGVCLSATQQLQVAQALADVINIRPIRHLCILPFATLLENIAGIYAPILAQGSILAPRLESLGMTGSSKVDLNKLLTMISTVKPNSLILLPQLLSALVTSIDFGWQPPKSLKFIAVGGGKVAPSLIAKARDQGLPVYEGYGLSECASVVSLNSPLHDRPGSVGKPLPHVKVALDTGEIKVSGNSFLGYVNDVDRCSDQTVSTGDLGYIDSEGFLHISGRRKNLLITSYGRNINPEWVESELLANTVLSQAIVYGDARPFCIALLAPGKNSADNTNEKKIIDQWVTQVNLSLPDYAQIKRWYRLPTPLSFSAGLLTSNGRPKRLAIANYYRQQIDKLYLTSNELRVQPNKNGTQPPESIHL